MSTSLFSFSGDVRHYNCNDSPPNNAILFAFNSSKLDFSGGQPSWYYSHISTLNSGVLLASWSSRLLNAMCQKEYKYTYKYISIVMPKWYIWDVASNIFNHLYDLENFFPQPRCMQPFQIFSLQSIYVPWERLGGKHLPSQFYKTGVVNDSIVLILSPPIDFGEHTLF